MSLKRGLVWTFPAICVASWLAVRSPAASPPAMPSTPSAINGLGDPPVHLTTVRSTREVRDPALARLITRFAAAARFGQP